MAARGRSSSRRISGALLAAGLAVSALSCATTRTIRSREEFASIPGSRPIRVFAQHETVYRLRDFTLGDSLVHGSGTRTERGQTTHFAGDIPFSEIVAITTTSPSVMKTLLLAGVTVLFVAAIEDAHGSGGLDPQTGTSYHQPASNGGGGFGTSCPYVYAWDGTRWVLAAEPFGTALGRALETTTTHLLPAERAENGVVRLRLANERRETHFVNSVRVSAIDLGSASAAVIDVSGTAWPLVRPTAPIRATDRVGRDVLSRLAAADGRSWEGDSTSTRPGSGYEDVLEVAFVRPRHAVDGSLVLTGINTTFSSALYAQMCRWVGSGTPALARAIETDPPLIAELRDYLRDASLAVKVWDGRAWVDAGAYPPEANAVAFTRALRIHVPPSAGDTVRVRLRSMADVWRIDALTLDCGASRPLHATPLRLVSARGPAGKDVRGEIDADDGRYTILLPPDRIELEYAAEPERPGHRVAYTVAARGYLMEWDPPPASGAASLPAAWEPGDRVAMLKQLLRDRDLVLAPAYEEWRRSAAQ